MVKLSRTSLGLFGLAGFAALVGAAAGVAPAGPAGFVTAPVLAAAVALATALTGANVG